MPAKDTSVILIWLDGGPSHMDLYDMKPDAPTEYRGIWSPIKTNVPGIEISELCKEQAKVADKLSILRSLHHDNGDHFTGAHLMLTSRGGANGARHNRQVPIDWLDRGAAARRAEAGPPALCRGAVCEQRRHSAGLLWGKLCGHGVQPV